MKTFKNIAELKEEKLRLMQERAVLEKKIESDWGAFKHSLRPINIVRQVFAKTLEKNSKIEETKAFVAESLSQIAIKLTKVLTEKVENKIEDWITKK